ncbi:MAG: triosephosphate isomerase [Bradymonadales bacterium]|nr:MAG: triosephosphate isomerase [Bradymonadales bacterium]
MKLFGNWKMAQSRQGAQSFAADASGYRPDPLVESLIFASCLQIPEMMERLKDWSFGAQDCSAELPGPYTGQVSAREISEFGVKDLLLGHSECRAAGQSEELLKRKLERAKEASLRLCYCVGESLQEREEGRLWDCLSRQLENLENCSAEFCIAYEPVWAIGTGKTASLERIAEVHLWIQAKFPKVPILYGGSVKPENSAEIMGLESVGGLLVGTASLKWESLEKILELASLEAQKRRQRAK